MRVKNDGACDHVIYLPPKKIQKGSGFPGWWFKYDIFKITCLLMIPNLAHPEDSMYPW